MKKLTPANLRLLLELINEAVIPSSKLKGSWADIFKEEHQLISISHGSRISYRVADSKQLREFISMNYDIKDIEEALTVLEQGEGVSRAELVQVAGDSKMRKQRTMTGFLVNSYEEIPAILCGESFQIKPLEGSFLYIYDFHHFMIPEDVLVVGVENAENFRCISRQKYLFKDFGKVLFVSRYPQNGDLIKWLSLLPNKYLHFGDFDLAGVNIFLTEIYSSLGPERSSFFIPEDIEERIKNGNRKLYDSQYSRFSNMKVTDERLQGLVNLINREHKVYEQEGYIE